MQAARFLIQRWQHGHVPEVEVPSTSASMQTDATPSSRAQPDSIPSSAETPATVPGTEAGLGAPPPPGYGPPPGQVPPPWYGWATPTQPPQPEKRSFWRSAMFAWIVAGALVLAVVGLSVALATRSSTPTVPIRPFTPPSTRPFPGGPGFFGGGLGRFAVTGTVASVGTDTFTVTAVSGQTVTVEEQSSTTYYTGTTSASSSIVVKGARVVVQGTRTGTTIKATRIIVAPSGGAFGFGRL